VLHESAGRLVGRYAEREPAVRTVLDRIGGITSERDELWQRMLRREVTERDYWAQRATELGAALGERWDTRVMIDRLYQLPRAEWLRADMIALMTDTRKAGLPLGALTNDMAAFHGQDWVDRQDYLELFDVFIDASVTGVLKPDPRAFRSAAEALGLPPDQVVFLDDMPGNVEGARAVGMTAIRVPWDDPAPAIDTARDLLGLPARPRSAQNCQN
jgi:putative hydrolase of the HAD superfamily